jgi:hypothetical protein
LGINDDGDIVGYYRVEPNNQDHGFLLSGGAVTSIDVPGASQTHAIGIDAAGEIFGGYCHGGNECYMPGRGVHGFLLAAGVFTPLDFPGAVFTEAWGRDRAGRIAGRYQDAGGLFHAFLLSSGTFSSVDFPGAAETAPGWYALAGGMAASGDLASSYCAVEPCLDPSPNVHGFVLKEGRFTSFDPPGSLFTDALGMNPTGAVVGAYLGPDGHYHGFLRTP